MVTVYYVATTVPTFPIRHALKAAGGKWDAQRKQWWTDSADVARRLVNVIGDGLVEPIQRDSYPKGKPRGKPFRPGHDGRRDGVVVKPEPDSDSQDGDNDEPEPEPQPSRTDDAGQQLAALVRKLAGSAIDAKQVNELVTARMAQQSASILADVERRLAKQEPRNIAITVQGLPTVQIGLAHKDLERIVKRVSIRKADGSRRFPNVRVVGPAGSGKTTLAEQLAKALDLAFIYMSATRSMPESRLEGKRIQNIMTGEEKYIPSSLVSAYTQPALYLLDEADNLDGSAAVCVNMATGNGHWALPDGTVLQRHQDMVFLLAMNTWGNGQDRQYMREQQDAAFLDRFSGASFFIGYDAKLEAAIASRKDVRERFNAIRVAAEGKVRRILSTRMLSAANDIAEAEGMDASDAIRETMPDWTASDLAAVGL